MPDISKERLTAEAIRKQLEASKQMADVEFQMDIAPNLNYRGPIDPRSARLRTTDLDVPTETRGYRIPTVSEYAKDYVMSEDEAAQKIAETPLRTKYIGMGARPPLPVEAGTVNVVDARNARPEVWAHEYRHAQGLGREDENLNRKIDAWNAQNQSQWDDAVEMERYRRGKPDQPLSFEEAEKDLLAAMRSYDENPPKLWEKHKDMFVNNPWWKRKWQK